MKLLEALLEGLFQFMQLFNDGQTCRVKARGQARHLFIRQLLDFFLPRMVYSIVTASRTNLQTRATRRPGVVAFSPPRPAMVARFHGAFPGKGCP